MWYAVIRCDVICCYKMWQKFRILMFRCFKTALHKKRARFWDYLVAWLQRRIGEWLKRRAAGLSKTCARATPLAAVHQNVHTRQICQFGISFFSYIYFFSSFIYFFQFERLILPKTTCTWKVAFIALLAFCLLQPKLVRIIQSQLWQVMNVLEQCGLTKMASVIKYVVQVDLRATNVKW